MNEFDEELRNALRRKQPPEGFSERVLAQAGASKRHSWFDCFSGRSLRWALSGAICLALLLGGIAYRKTSEERAEGEAAKTELMLAMRITAEKLKAAQSIVRHYGIQQEYRNR